MTARHVLTTVQELPRDGRESTKQRLTVARFLAGHALAVGLIQVDPVIVTYVDEAPSVAGAVRAAAAAVGVNLTEGDLDAYDQIEGWRSHVGVCPVVEPLPQLAIDPTQGMSASLRELLENGWTAPRIAARTRMSIDRIDSIRASLRLPYKSARLNTGARAMQAAGSR
jgi:hypothetical protein